MKKRVFIFMLAILVSYFSNIEVTSSAASKNIDVFSGLVNYTDGKIVEYGIDLTMNMKNIKNNDIDGVLKNIHECANLKIDKIYTENTYCLNFSGSNINGYVESIKNAADYSINMELIIRDNKNNIDNLVDEIKNIDLFKGNGVRIFRYMKIKIDDADNIENINSKIINFLNSRYAEHINTVKLDNAYSTTAYTGNKDYVIEGNKAVDINIAVCRYTSGYYVIIGTPIIMILY